jgi:Micrococcal nuclease (thermonuclease) homologs
MTIKLMGWGLIVACLALSGCLADAESKTGLSTTSGESGEQSECRLQGKVVKVADGDTVTVLDAEKQQHKVRLLGIDAPEKKQAFGQVSKDTLAGMVAGKTVCVAWQKQDQYQRTIGSISVDGVAVNMRMVQLGMAWHYKQYAKEQAVADRAAFSAAEAEARANRVGLWADANPVAPWDFRKQH